MIDLKTLEPELERAMSGWRAYEKDLIKHRLSGPLQATAVGVKVADKAEFQQTLVNLLSQTKQLHVGTVNDRLIATFVLQQPFGGDGLKLIKVLERRPGSQDPLGLDHIDFYVKDIKVAQDALVATPANWEKQSNEVHRWLSVRYGEELEYEAKLVDHTVLNACIVELTEVNQSLVK